MIARPGRRALLSLALSPLLARPGLALVRRLNIAV